MAKKKEELEKDPKTLAVEEPVEENVVISDAESEEKSETVEHTEEKVAKEEEHKEVEEYPVKEDIPDENEPVVGEQSVDAPRIFPPYAYDVKSTKEDTLQEKLLMQQGLHYLAQKIKMQKEVREAREMSVNNDIPKMEIMYYGTYSVDWTDVRYREIGKTIPEIAYLNYWAPQRCVMLNVEWLPRLVADGYILKDLTPGTWEGYINERNVAKYMRKVDYLLKKGKIRP